MSAAPHIQQQDVHDPLPAEPARPATKEGGVVRASLRREQSVERRDLEERAEGLKPDRVALPYQDYQFFIPSNWYLISPAMIAGLALAFLVSGGFPPLPIIGAAGFAVCLSALGKFFGDFERRQDAQFVSRVGLMIVAIALPMFLFGLSIGHMALLGSLDKFWGGATIVGLLIFSTSLLNRRFVATAVAQLSAWAGVVAFSGSLIAALAFVGVLISTSLLTYNRVRILARNAERNEKLNRVRTRAEDILRDYEETGQGWFWETDRRGQLTYLSDGVAKALGRTKKELFSDHVTELFQLGDDDQDGERTLTFHLSARSSFQELAVRANIATEERWWSINGRPVYDEFRNFIGFRGSGMDLTEKRRSQENASRLAHYDSLTSLANRFQMSQSLEKILNSPQERERECSVMLLDLDRFKQVNDTLGHPTGDALLKQVAQRLERAVGKLGRVGRIGGDEFQIILPGRLGNERLGQLSTEIIHSVSQPYTLDGQRVTIGVSIGISLCPDNGVTSESLIRNADLALYAAKDGGRGRYHFFANNLHSAAEERSALEEDLRDAIAQGNLELFYQPVVSTKTSRIAGFEALLRWHHPSKGWLSPAKFIPIAEDTGLITPIGEWALRTACEEMANWPEEVRCAVNVSPLQFANPNLPTIITQALAQSGVNPSRLELEITESVFLNDDAGTDAMFAALKRIGVRLALDDFGTGYSSLGYLKKAPFDKIKIDQSFVRGATEEGSRNGAIITSITSLADALGMDTTAEGVETLDELELVEKLGCSHVQGYIYASAMSSEATRTRLADGLAAVASGPRSSRAKRHKTLRKVTIAHGDHQYDGTIRNISANGALVEGLWNVPPGTLFKIAVTDSLTIDAVSKWSEEDKMGVEFAVPLKQTETGIVMKLAKS